MNAPRGTPGRIRNGAYSPEADQFAALARAVARNELPLADVIAELDNRNRFMLGKCLNYNQSKITIMTSIGGPCN